MTTDRAAYDDGFKAGHADRLLGLASDLRLGWHPPGYQESYWRGYMNGLRGGRTE